MVSNVVGKYVVCEIVELEVDCIVVAVLVKDGLEVELIKVLEAEIKGEDRAWEDVEKIGVLRKVLVVGVVGVEI